VDCFLFQACIFRFIHPSSFYSAVFMNAAHFTAKACPSPERLLRLTLIAYASCNAESAK
jgi:hypothetical protein